MHLTIYVHDFHPQIGHSRAMQELLNGLSSNQKNSISSVEVVAFTCTDVEVLFPSFKCYKHFTRVPFPDIHPFLFKIIFYHLFSLIHSLTIGAKKKKIGIGIACLNIDIVNVQFIHEQWKTHFFQSREFSFFSKYYKKLLFLYFFMAEKFIYSYRKNIKYIVIANFLKTFLNKKFNTDINSMLSIPSGVNIDEFKLLELTNENLLAKLSINHPEIKKINPTRPIALFIGALERKGLNRALTALNKIPNIQLVVIGKSEQRKFKMPTLSFQIIHIPFSKDVNLFYQLADFFIFPTQYEPFGLVIIEAYAMGLDILIPTENVGASEIIPKTNGVYFFHQGDEINLPTLKKIPLEEKKIRRIERLGKIKQYSWEASANKFYSILFS